VGAANEGSRYINKPPNIWGVDLTEADLNRSIAGPDQLRALSSAKSLKGATMPNGQKFEGWFKSKSRGEDEQGG
jgi:hypothetical protein